MNRPLPVTVLMTVYNGKEYLKTAIEHVLAQSFRDFEFLIIDDCSTDGSDQIVQSFTDNRIVFNRNSNNIGQTKSLNLGLQIARGEFIARMDVDDLAFGDWLGEGAAFLRAQAPHVVLVSPLAVIIDGDNQVHKILNTPRSFPEIVIKSLWGSPVNHVGSLMRREAVLSQGGYDEAYRIAADYALWSKFLRNGFQLAVLPQALVAVRSHAASVTAVSAGKDDIAEMGRIMSENIAHWAKFNLTKAQALLFWQLIYNVQGLDPVQLAEAYDVFCLVRRAFLQHCPGGMERVDRLFGKESRTIFIKKTFDCIKRRDMGQLRAVARLYINRHGALNIFSLGFLCSYVGFALFLIPDIYLYYRRAKAIYYQGQKL